MWAGQWITLAFWDGVGTFVVACAKKTCELPVYYNTIRNFSKVQLKLCRRRTALSSLPQNPAPEPSAPPALIQNTSLRCDWFSCHLPDSGQCFQNLQWSGARLQMQAKHFAVQQLALVFQATTLLLFSGGADACWVIFFHWLLTYIDILA